MYNYNTNYIWVISSEILDRRNLEFHIQFITSLDQIFWILFCLLNRKYILHFHEENYYVIGWLVLVNMP
jgi:hypothetical protein